MHRYLSHAAVFIYSWFLAVGVIYIMYRTIPFAIYMGFLSALVVSLFALSYKKYEYCILGMQGGFLVGIYTFSLIFSKWADKYVMISWLLIGLLSMTILSYKYLNKRIMELTAAVGALYTASSIIALAHQPLYEDLDWTFALAVGVAVALFFAGRFL